MVFRKADDRSGCSCQSPDTGFLGAHDVARTFVHLRVHTAYSLAEGARFGVKDLVARCKGRADAGRLRFGHRKPVRRA